MKSKRFMRKITMSVFSVLLALMMIAGFTFTPALSVDAAVTQIESVYAGDSWSGAWATGDKYLRLNVTETGFYSLTLTDNLKTGMAFAIVNDVETEETKGVYIGDLTEPQKMDMMYLIADRVYELGIAYLLADYTDYAAANMTISFTKLDFSATELPSGALSDSDVSITLSEGETAWLCYTTAQAGDYSFNFSDIDAFVTVYNAQTGEMLENYDAYTRYSEVDGEYYYRDSIVFKLAADTEYLFRVDSFFEGESSTKVSISKNKKTVEFIEASKAIYDIFCRDSIGNEYFEYKVSYTNGTTSTLPYSTLAASGIELPLVLCLADSVDVNGEYLWQGGKAPVVSMYGEDYSFIYVDIDSVTDWLISIDAAMVGANHNCEFVNNGTEESTGYWHINVSNTAYYGYTSHDDFESNLDYWSAVMIDEQNNIVEYNEELNAWPLVAGRDYAFSLARTFKENSSVETMDFFLTQETDKIFPDTDKKSWYSNAVTYSVGRDVINGYGNGNFGPGDSIQRQDFLVMLARFDGEDLSYYEDMDCPFPDVPKGSYYEAAIMWGYENGIVSGYQNGKFGVGDKITREQLVTFLHRYADAEFADTSYSETTQNTVKNNYTDYKNVTDYAQEPVLWAIENGIIRGKTETTIVPQGNALRCEVAQIMYNIFTNDVF